MPIKVPMTFMTNSGELAEALAKRCTCRVKHSRTGNELHTRGIDTCTADLSREVCQGIARQLEMDGADLHFIRDGTYHDEITGEEIDSDSVQRARQEEVEYFERMGVLEKVPYERAHERTGRRPIAVKWVDVVKAGGKYRSRLVAKEVNTYKDDSLFAATPPLESMKYLLARLTAEEYKRDKHCNENEDWIIAHVDVHRAYFYAKAKREVYVELPIEMQTGAKLQCGMLRRAMYGTRDAASAWQDEYECTLAESEFVQGLASPCHFRHASRACRTWRRLRYDRQARFHRGRDPRIRPQIFDRSSKDGPQERRRQEHACVEQNYFLDQRGHTIRGRCETC